MKQTVKALHFIMCTCVDVAGWLGGFCGWRLTSKCCRALACTPHPAHFSATLLAAAGWRELQNSVIFSNWRELGKESNNNNSNTNHANKKCECCFSPCGACGASWLPLNASLNTISAYFGPLTHTTLISPYTIELPATCQWLKLMWRQCHSLCLWFVIYFQPEYGRDSQFNLARNRSQIYWIQLHINSV